MARLDLNKARREMPHQIYAAFRELSAAMWNPRPLDPLPLEMLRLKSAQLGHCVH